MRRPGAFLVAHPRSSASSAPVVHHNDPAAITTIAAAVSAAPATPVPAIVALTAIPPVHGFRVFDIPSGRRLWETSSAIDARPWLVGDLVVSHANSEVIAWSASAGQERWRHPDDGLSLIGAGGDDRYVALSLGVGGLDHRNAAAIVVERATGATKFEDTAARSLGTPTVAGGYAIFPWDGQNVSIIDAAQGAETARISNCEDFVSRAMREGNAVYYGGPLLYRLTAASASGRREGAQSYAFPREDLPGRPHLLSSGYLVSYAGVGQRSRADSRDRAAGSRRADGVHSWSTTRCTSYITARSSRSMSAVGRRALGLSSMR